jgi:hypothetical protein
VKRPSDHNIIRIKWVFQNKQDENGVIVRNKARLIAQGYTQFKGLDFDEIFAPVEDLKLFKFYLLMSPLTISNYIK